MTVLNEFCKVASEPVAYGKELRKTGRKKIVGFFCSYVPEEFIYAAGAHPFRIFGTGEGVQLADAHFQSYCCSLVRGALEGKLAGRFDFLDGVVFPHTCDSIQRLSDIWRINIKDTFHLDIVLPVKLDTPSARDYMMDVLKRFRSDLQNKLDTSASDENLKKAISVYNRIRSYLKRIYEIKLADPGIITGSDLYAVIKASMIMDRDRLLEIFPLLIEELEKKKGEASNAGKRIILAGGICNHPDIYRLVEEAGGQIAWDDLCTGSRYFAEIAEETQEPVISFADRYIKRPPCPAKHSGLFSRAGHLVRLAKEKKARGVIFLFLKFCDPHAFDYPYIREALEREGIPSIILEVEDQLPAEGQLQTRLETFMHML